MRLVLALLLVPLALAAADLDPRGQIHIPIGVPNSLDTLKTFVEAEGNFSPGFGSYGISFSVFDVASQKLVAPTMPGVEHQHGLAGIGSLIPWSEWRAGSVKVRTEVCEVQRESPAGAVFVVGARAHLTNSSAAEQKVTLFANVRPIGAAGGPIHRLGFRDDVLFANEQAALLPNTAPTAVEAPASDEILKLTAPDRLPREPSMHSTSGTCTGAMRFDVTLAPGETKSFGFVCPVLPGRRAVRHRWDGVSKWAQLDESDPIRGTPDGVVQPAPDVAFYRALKADELFVEAAAYWKKFSGRVQLDLPDKRWAECLAAITGHAALTMNEGAPDVAVINYNVFSRDGVYVANILQKSGNHDLAREAIDYFLAHPFNGRVEPEADNPGQVLWILAEHWRFTRDRAWLERIYPSAKKLAAMIAYYRLSPEPHWVNPNSLDFGDALPEEKRQRLRPGACDGHHPEYTEAFDIAGMHAAAALAEAMKSAEEHARWGALAADLEKDYDAKYGADLRKREYGNYSVLWPCRLFPLASARAAQFARIGAQKPTSWRYFPLARAHQGLLAGNREAAHGTLGIHLDHEQMRGWYAFDEGGPSGPGNWGRVLSNWKVTKQGEGGVDSAIAMPHGWAIAEMHLLLRDALVFEDTGKLVLFAGVPAGWFTQPMRVGALPTHFGVLTAEWQPGKGGGKLILSGDCAPPGGFVLRAPGKDIAATRGETVVPSLD